MVDHPDVAIVGGGVIGLATAWRAAQAGLRVTVFDPHPQRGAWRAAAGMLAPVTEAHFGEERLLALSLASARRYPDFVAELGDDVGYSTAGTLTAAFDAGDRALVTQLHNFRQRLGLAAELLTGRECRELEPMLAPGVRAGVFVPDDHSVDPRRLVPALRRVAERAGAKVVAAEVSDLLRDTTAPGVRLKDATEVTAGKVVVAAGCWSGRLAGLPVRPVKGHILRLRAPGLLTRSVRGMVAGTEIYFVPRSDGELVLGATMEELGFDTTVTAGGVYTLLRDGHALVPGLTEVPLIETYAGLRPGSPDNAPLVGPVPGYDGIIAATGHHRNGILLAPVTADAVATLLTTGSLPAEVAPFSPERFAAVPT